MSAIWALLGSGEFEPWSVQVDRRMVERPDARSGCVLILPTASAAEGDEVFERWASKGLDHFSSLGVEAKLAPLKTRDDAHRDDLLRMLDEASLVYFSGGNPAFLASVLRETPFWSATLRHMDRGLGYVGCSAGVASLGAVAPDSARRSIDEELWAPGLGVFPDTWFGPHWDTVDRFVPGLTSFFESSIPSGSTLIGIDEDTAMVGDGSRWIVVGVGSVHRYERGSWTRYGSGATFTSISAPAPAPAAEGTSA